MLKLERVRKHYKGFDLDCSLEVPAGRVTGLIGRNGAGKSTVFKSILGLIHTDGGTIEVLGNDIGDVRKLDKAKIGVVLADSGFSGYLKVKDLVPILRSLYSNFKEDYFLDMCEKFGLPMDKMIKEFSTGMKRKLQVISAISHDTKLLMLDEPTAGLDVVARGEVLDLLRGYMDSDDKTILISSHISSDLEGICDDFYMIDKGRILMYEETDMLLSEYGILKVTENQYQELEQSYIIKTRKEPYGYSCLTDKRRFFEENYPEAVIEKGNIDELINIMVGGEEQ